jgi:type IV pilus assembly protein PilA
VTATAISADINDMVVTLVPTDSAGTAMTYSASAQTVFKWICGGSGTTVPAKFLPGSCRGA